MKTLIAYYSWSGHTKMTAERIARVTGGNLFEIVPVTPYPRLYARCAIMAKAERDKNARPEPAFHNVGMIDDVIAKAAKLEEE